MKPEEKPHDEADRVILTADQLKSRAGTYLNPENDQPLRISMRGGKLHIADGPADEGYELRAVSESRFKSASARVELIFEDSQPGGPIQFVLQRGDGQPNHFAEVPSFNPSGSQLREYAGIYSSDEIEPLYDVRLEKGDLVLHRLRNKPDMLHPVTLDLFAGSIGSIRFIRSSSGKVSGFMLSTGRIKNMRFVKGRQLIPANASVANSH
jgi:hypothetical protein